MQRFDTRTAQAGFSLPELLVAMAVLGILAAMSFGAGQSSLALMRVESTSRRLALGDRKSVV